jgi:hypothetical protein
MKLLQPLWTVIWKSFAFITSWAILLALFIVPFQSKLKQLEQANPLAARLYLEFAAVITIVLAACLFTLFVDKRPFHSLGFDTTHIVRDVVLGTAIGFLWLIASLAILWLGGWTSLQQSIVSPSLLALAAVAVLINVITQEVLLRSYIFQTIQKHFGVIAAVVITSLLFAGFHAGAIKNSWLAAFNVFGAGVLFGIAYAVSGNLWLPIAIHFSWNFALGPLLGLSVSGQNPYRVNWQLLKLNGPTFCTGGTFGLEGSIIVTASTIVFAIGLLLLYRRLL